jgi:hypothetical protein
MTLRDHRFGSHGDVQQAVQMWLHEQPKSFFFEGMKNSLNNTRSASLCSGTMSKSNMRICSPSVELKLLSRNCLYFPIHPCTNTFSMQMLFTKANFCQYDFCYEASITKMFSSYFHLCSFHTNSHKGTFPYLSYMLWH